MAKAARTRKRPKVNETPLVTDIICSNSVLYGLEIFPGEIWDQTFTLLLVNPSGITYHDLRRRKIPGVPPIPIMQVCKAWYQRAQYIFYAKNHFRFDSMRHMTSSLKRMALDSRRTLRSVEVKRPSIWGMERDNTPHELRECTSLQVVRMEFPHSLATRDIAGLKLIEVFEDMRDLKEITIGCPIMSTSLRATFGRCFALGKEQTTVKEPQCFQCNRLQAHLEKMVFKPWQEGLTEAVMKRKREPKEWIEQVAKRKRKSEK